MARDETQRRLACKLRDQLGEGICTALDDARVIEIFLNDDGSLLVERLGEPMVKIRDGFNAQGAEAIIRTIASSLSTTCTDECPILSGEWPAGNRHGHRHTDGPHSPSRWLAAETPRRSLHDWIDRGCRGPSCRDGRHPSSDLRFGRRLWPGAARARAPAACGVCAGRMYDRETRWEADFVNARNAASVVPWL
jgi:hypothetical protein